MSAKAFYELEGIRPDGSTFTVEILGKIDLADAVSLARYYAGLWNNRVRLYRVPYLNTSSAHWADDEMELVNEFTSEHIPRPEPPEQWKGQTEWLRRLFDERTE
jgi:hypothetical protein